MIIDQKKTTLAYRCPHCGSVPTSIVGAFSLSGDLFKLKCSCGHSHLTVEKTREDKLRLTVPCIVCPQPHSYILSKNVFFGSDIFVIPCSLCGIDICFIGKEREVASAVVRSNDEILKSLGDTPIDSLRGKEEEEYTDPAIFDMITYVISDLNDEGKIYCRCPEGHGDYLAKILNDSVEIECKNCGAKATILARSTQNAEDFLHTESLTLK